MYNVIGRRRPIYNERTHAMSAQGRWSAIYALLGAALLLFIAPGDSCAATVEMPAMVVNGTEIAASSRIALDPAYIEEIRKGVQKEVIFYIDLYRVWKRWPDEFVTGRSIERILHCDNVKQEHTVRTSEEGSPQVKRFKTCDELIAWATRVEGIGLLVPTPEAESNTYYVRVSAESRMLRLPPFVDMLLFFIRVDEFRASAETPPFDMPGAP